MPSNQDLRSGGGPLHVEAEMVAKLMSANLFVTEEPGDAILGSGAEGARTPDLRHAMAALFQLSYSPKPIFLCQV